MNEFARDQWQRAIGSLRAARHLTAIDPDSAASRAYYAAFHAVTALFALRDQSFTKHAAIRAAVHRDLVKSGEWPEELGRDYDYLVDLREMGDYGGASHVDENDAKEALKKARAILKKVHDSAVELFPQDSLD